MENIKDIIDYRRELIRSVVARLRALPSEYENYRGIPDRFKGSEPAPQVEIDFEELVNLEKLLSKTDEFKDKFTASNEVGKPTVPLILFFELKEIVKNIKDENLKEEIERQIEKIESVAKNLYLWMKELMKI